jgi:ABC-type transporter Mla MlaB component
MQPALVVSSYRLDDAVVLRMTGDLTGDTLAALKAILGRVEPILDRLLHDRFGVLVIDLAALEACDLSGLAVLSAISDAARNAGVEPRLAAAPGRIRTLLADSQLGDRVAQFGTVHGAARDDPGDLVMH